MSTSRRDFLKTSIIVGAGAALPALPAHAVSGEQAAAGNEGSLTADPSGYTRGIGAYPGAPHENFSPRLVLDKATYRNLALLRPAYHSSSYDYNLTAQLVTDGIKDSRSPSWVSTAVSGRGTLPKSEREIFLDHFHDSTIELHGARVFAEIHLGSQEVPEIDRIAVFVIVTDTVAPESLSFSISTSQDGREWEIVGRAPGGTPLPPENYPPDMVRGTHLIYPSIPLKSSLQSAYYRVDCLSTSGSSEGMRWQLGQVEFYKSQQRVQVGGPYEFTSAWMSAGLGREWVYVDLGAPCEFDRVSLYWIARAAEGKVQVSDDAVSWMDLQGLSATGALVDDIRLSPSARGRYVRVLMTRPSSPLGYILSEFEVYGRGGPVPKPCAAQLPDADKGLDLAGGAWRVQRASLVEVAGETLSMPGYRADTWVVATVPGTVLTSYLNAGAIPDPNYSSNQLHISDSFFYSDFWYHTEFTTPATDPDEMVWLNLDGINWKADVFFNGEKLGRIEGGFLRSKFDITHKVWAGKANALAVRVEKNATPGSTKQKTLENVGKNGGALGADNPTYHASIGWDWIPTIRGRNSGIWGDVFLSVTRAITIEKPHITTILPLPDISRADLAITAELVNHSTRPVPGTFHARFGTTHVEQKAVIPPAGSKVLRLDPATHPALRLEKPQLWWPVGYGDPHLYDVELEFEAEGHKVTDKKTFQAGIRQFTYGEEGGDLRIFINGRRFVARGGNWGFGESMLRYRAREYDAAVRYHREMNFTMVRNWVGQIGDDAFYDACDRHGVVVWQDFWLANPWDGPIPDNDGLFMSNARDLILRIRNHASVGLYCGRNEGNPPNPLEKALREALSELHSDLHYIPSSADDVVSGHGPYMALAPATYFRNADHKLHSEIGMPNIPSLESVRAMMPEASLWPQALDWGIHDFCLDGAQGGTTFRSIIDEGYGGANSAEEWISLAQFVNYEGYRAMFEAQSKYRMGLLLWMSHCCWPSFVWQTYDYFLEPTSAYFACKKASEPLHIQWNRSTDKVEVMNYSAGNQVGLTAKAELFNIDGSIRWSKMANVDSAEDSTLQPIQMEYPAGLSQVHFLRTTLTSGTKSISSNTYLRGLEDENYRAIRALPMVRVQAKTAIRQEDRRWFLTTEIRNPSTVPALMVRLKVVREQSGDRVLPAIYSDNYVHLLPGEKQTVEVEVYEADTRGERPVIIVSGFNVSL